MRGLSSIVGDWLLKAVPRHCRVEAFASPI